MDDKNKTLKTFAAFDKLGFEEFADNLTSFIETERRFVDESLLISLNGKFGSGKSTFFEMWREQLINAKDPRFSVITLNAWDADFERDALLSIVSAFVQYFESKGFKDNTEELKITVGKLAKFGLSLGNQIVRNKLGVDFQEAQRAAEPQNSGLLEKACFDLYKDRQDAFEELKNLLKLDITKNPLPIIIIVDELDRCRPDYAVEYLETIKHIFDLTGLVFVLGVDKSSLSSSVKSLFGESLNFDEYYRKFVHRNINLPSIGNISSYDGDPQHRLSAYVSFLIKKYLKSEELNELGRYNYAKWENTSLKKSCHIFLDLDLSPRQMHEVFRILAHSLSANEARSSNMLWSWQLGTVFLASLSVADSALYKKIGLGRVTVADLTDYFNKPSIMMANNQNALWWTSFIMMGSIRSDNILDEYKALLSGLRVSGNSAPLSSILEDNSINNSLEQMNAGYDKYDSGEKTPYQLIYETIEAIKKFAE